MLCTAKTPYRAAQLLSAVETSLKTLQAPAEVTRVHVTITNEDGVILEQGSASLAHKGLWKYETGVQGEVLVEVSDRAGNVNRQGAGGG